MKGRLLLDVVVGKGTAILELLSGKDKTLLIRGNSFLVLDLGLDVVNGVAWLDIKSDGLSGQSLDENLRGERENLVSDCGFQSKYKNDCRSCQYPSSCFSRTSYVEAVLVNKSMHPYQGVAVLCGSDRDHGREPLHCDS